MMKCEINNYLARMRHTFCVATTTTTQPWFCATQTYTFLNLGFLGSLIEISLSFLSVAWPSFRLLTTFPISNSPLPRFSFVVPILPFNTYIIYGTTWPIFHPCSSKRASCMLMSDIFALYYSLFFFFSFFLMIYFQRDYAPGSEDAKQLKAACDKLRNECPEIPCIVGGKEVLNYYLIINHHNTCVTS